jgi:hypothetical protein
VNEVGFINVNTDYLALKGHAVPYQESQSPKVPSRSLKKLLYSDDEVPRYSKGTCRRVVHIGLHVY